MRRQILPILLLSITFLPSLLKADVLSVSSTTVSLGVDFNLPVTVSGASDLYAFQFDISFNPLVLQLQSIAEGSLLSSVGPTFFIPGTIDNIGGTATFTANTLIGLIPGAAGNGTIATLDFQPLANGVSTLALANVLLLDSNLNDISFSTTSGQVTVGATAPELGSLWLLLSGLLCCFLLVLYRRLCAISAFALVTNRYILKA
jgi:hypothetical protein